MSTNCIRCIVKPRTGPDLLCDDCRKESGVGSLASEIDREIDRQERKAERAPNPAMDKEYLREAAEAVNARLPDNHGFILLVMPFGGGGRLRYVSSICREDAVNVMKEFLIMAGHEEDWMKHLP